MARLFMTVHSIKMNSNFEFICNLAIEALLAPSPFVRYCFCFICYNWKITNNSQGNCDEKKSDQWKPFRQMLVISNRNLVRNYIKFYCLCKFIQNAWQFAWIFVHLYALMIPNKPRTLIQTGAGEEAIIQYFLNIET